MFSSVSSRSGLRQVAGLVCAAAYLLGETETLPQLLALGAWLEGSHRVQVAQAGDQVTVVLSHQRGSPRRPDYTARQQAGNPQHWHGPAARLFCCLAEPAGSKADHIASFASGAICEYARGAIKAKVNGSEAPADVSWSAMLSHEPAIPEPLSGTVGVWARLRPPGGLGLLGSTVLVI